jgi:hypothetical protein
MAVELVELDNRVLEIEQVPDTPGVCHRTISFRVLSGPPLAAEEFVRIKQALVRHLIGEGAQVLGVTPSFER